MPVDAHTSDEGREQAQRAQVAALLYQSASEAMVHAATAGVVARSEDTIVIGGVGISLDFKRNPNCWFTCRQSTSMPFDGNTFTVLGIRVVWRDSKGVLRSFFYCVWSFNNEHDTAMIYAALADMFMRMHTAADNVVDWNGFPQEFALQVRAGLRSALFGSDGCSEQFALCRYPGMVLGLGLPMVVTYEEPGHGKSEIDAVLFSGIDGALRDVRLANPSQPDIRVGVMQLLRAAADHSRQVSAPCAAAEEPASRQAAGRATDFSRAPSRFSQEPAP